MKKIIEDYIEHYNNFSIQSMLELFSDECIFQQVTNGSVVITTRGKEELENLAQQSRTLFSLRSQTVTNWIIDADKAAIEVDFTATLAQDLPNGAKKGAILKLKGVSIFEFKSGKISRLVDYS
ncbi:MAG: nuclear transport factor 2 family protein [Chlamydiales bacterium]